MDMLKWIQNWYSQNCDGDWEHSFGIKIATLDNPGWLVDIDLAGTDLEFKHFEVVKIFRNEFNWVHCSVVNEVFNGNGGAGNLEEILKIFYEWASEIDSNTGLST